MALMLKDPFNELPKRTTMTRTEFKQIGIDVFMELLPKVKMTDMQEFLDTLMTELNDQGLEIEDDEDEDSGEADDDFEEL